MKSSKIKLFVFAIAAIGSGALMLWFTNQNLYRSQATSPAPSPDLSFLTPTPTPDCTRCDFNGDGIYDASDASKLTQCMFSAGIQECLDTDINGDGKVDAADLTAANLCAFNRSAFPNCPYADRNNDGVIDTADITIIARCTFVPNVSECNSKDANRDGKLDAGDLSFCGLYCAAPTPTTTAVPTPDLTSTPISTLPSTTPAEVVPTATISPTAAVTQDENKRRCLSNADCITSSCIPTAEYCYIETCVSGFCEGKTIRQNPPDTASPQPSQEQSPTPQIDTACEPSSADANKDGKSNLGDFEILRSEFDLSGNNRADFNCDGNVTILDFAIWRDSFIKTIVF